jgi:methylated-DNA-protein-cysteine methyltransferase-like protein
MNFFQQVYQIVAQSPEGKVVTYGQIAELLGRPGAARAVGFAMRHCPEELPWQRVVSADGTLHGESAELRQTILAEEGVPFTPDGRVDLNSSRWIP